eukprot:8959289-Ditylum_brightwellii.AAC.1
MGGVSHGGQPVTPQCAGCFGPDEPLILVAPDDPEQLAFAGYACHRRYFEVAREAGPHQAL